MKTAELLNKVCDLVIEVGRYQAEQRKSFSRDKVEMKNSHDYVSYVDKESERRIVTVLREILPEAGFVTEEKTTEQNGADSEYCWIIDPLDGTTNFIHNLGPWCVCIALRHRQQLVLGVVYEVTRSELFYATLGGGAWLRTMDGHTAPLQVSPVSELDQALVVIGYPYNAEGFRSFCTTLIGQLYGHCASVRSFGSAEAEICYVAAGRQDVFVESFVKAWDVSAGAVILKEAKGRISDYQGENLLWPDGREVLATNASLHSSMLQQIEKCK